MTHWVVEGGQVPVAGTAATRSRPGRRRLRVQASRLLTALASAVLLMESAPPLQAAATQAQSGVPSQPRSYAPLPDTTVQAAPIPYDNSGNGGDGIGNGAADPSVHLRPTFVPVPPPAVKTALKARWNADR